jgi:hypothetical protein
VGGWWCRESCVAWPRAVRPLPLERSSRFPSLLFFLFHTPLAACISRCFLFRGLQTEGRLVGSPTRAPDLGSPITFCFDATQVKSPSIGASYIGARNHRSFTCHRMSIASQFSHGKITL